MKAPWNPIALGAAMLMCAAPVSVAQAQSWEPTRTIEIIVPAGTGGGADQMARVVQGIVTKYNLTKQSMVVVNKGGGAGGGPKRRSKRPASATPGTTTTAGKARAKAISTASIRRAIRGPFIAVGAARSAPRRRIIRARRRGAHPLRPF